MPENVSVFTGFSFSFPAVAAHLHHKHHANLAGTEKEDDLLVELCEFQKLYFSLQMFSWIPCLTT